MLKRAWAHWKEIARHLANFQTRLFLTVFYGLIVFCRSALLRASLLIPCGLRNHQPSGLTTPTKNPICTGPGNNTLLILGHFLLLPRRRDLPAG